MFFAFCSGFYLLHRLLLLFLLRRLVRGLSPSPLHRGHLPRSPPPQPARPPHPLLVLGSCLWACLHLPPLPPRWWPLPSSLSAMMVVVVEEEEGEVGPSSWLALISGGRGKIISLAAGPVNELPLADRELVWRMSCSEEGESVSFSFHRVLLRDKRRVYCSFLSLTGVGFPKTEFRPSSSENAGTRTGERDGGEGGEKRRIPLIFFFFFHVLLAIGLNQATQLKELNVLHEQM